MQFLEITLHSGALRSIFENTKTVAWIGALYSFIFQTFPEIESGFSLSFIELKNSTWRSAGVRIQSATAAESNESL